MNNDLVFGYCEDKGVAFLETIKKAGTGVFLIVLGNTEVAKIPHISAAGRHPELTDFTPAADAELVIYGYCRCIKGVPVTPDGIPTPAIITRSALKLYSLPVLIVNGGLNVTPQVPFFDLGGQGGRDFRGSPAVEKASEIVWRGGILGRELSKIADYIVIAESIPGGTTTSLAFLLAMGVDAIGKVSSSLRENPMDLKLQVVEEGMKTSGVNFGDFSEEPLKAIFYLGDPVIAAMVGILNETPSTIPILLAGGTQITAVLTALKSMNANRLENLAIGTTRWILQDSSSDIKGLMEQIAPIPIIASNLDFTDSRIPGLKAYESGLVKEGVGAGGSVINAIIKSEGKVTNKDVLTEIEDEYIRLVK